MRNKAKYVLILGVAMCMVIGLNPMSSLGSPLNELHLAVGTLSNQVGDPILAGATSNKEYLMAFYDHLVGVDENLNYNPDHSIAHKWQGNRDLKTWTFWLKKGIKFHNGDEITAEDVKFSMERFISGESVSSYKSYMLKTLDRVEVAEPYRVVYHLKKWDPFFYHMVSSFKASEGMILPKKYIEKHGGKYFAEHPVGSGPYRLVENAIGSYMKGEAVENHWRVGTPRFKYLYFHLVPEESTRIAGLKAGEFDLSSVSRDRLKDVRAAGLNIFENPGMILMAYFTRTHPETNPLVKLKVRKALNLALNRKEILNELFAGLGRVGVVGPATTLSIGYEPLESYPYDPEEAKKLLAEAGYPNGFSLDVYSYTRSGVPEGAKMMEVLAGYWENIGLKTRVVPGTYQSWRTHWLKDTHPNPASIGWVSYGTRIFPAVLYWYNMHSGSVFRAARAGNAELDALYDATTNVSTLEEYEKTASKLYKYAYENYMSMPVVEVSKFYAGNPKKVKKDWKPSRRAYDINVDGLVTGR
jgi:peptide/nickel transport system substrate-binding protein